MIGLFLLLRISLRSRLGMHSQALGGTYRVDTVRVGVLHQFRSLSG